MKTLDLSDFSWEEQGGTYDDDDRLHTHLGSADVIVDFSAERIGLKVHEDGGDQCYCYPLDKVPLDVLGHWRPDNRV
jgi:hypothetical protein